MTTLATHIRPRLRVRSLPVVLLGVVLVIASIVIMHAGRGTTFWFDDWNFVTERIGWRPYVLLFPHNEHLSLLRMIGIAIAVVLGAGALTNAPALNGVGDVLRAHALSSRASLSAAELLQDRLDPRTTIPDPGQPQLFLGRYESAVKAYDSTITWSHGRAYVKAGSAPVDVRLRRFGASLSADPQVKVDPGRAATVALPPDRSPQPWVVVVRSSAPFNACNL